ncbi:hypothetical protein C8Q74DRAFT_422941 [Fomes fomentarius]|nr:hypothetical protein C8Q74DRAFT_422941 [Fomes fomentarius]
MGDVLRSHSHLPRLGLRARRALGHLEVPMANPDGQHNDEVTGDFCARNQGSHAGRLRIERPTSAPPEGALRYSAAPFWHDALPALAREARRSHGPNGQSCCRIRRPPFASSFPRRAAVRASGAAILPSRQQLSAPGRGERCYVGGGTLQSVNRGKLSRSGAKFRRHCPPRPSPTCTMQNSPLTMVCVLFWHDHVSDRSRTPGAVCLSAAVHVGPTYDHVLAQHPCAELTVTHRFLLLTEPMVCPRATFPPYPRTLLLHSLRLYFQRFDTCTP